MANAQRIKNSSGEILAIFIPADVTIEGIEFYTDPEMDFQIGAMRRPLGHEVEPHVHSPVERELIGTKEVLFVRSGRIAIDFYDDDKKIVTSIEMVSGDVIYLHMGGHGIRFIEESVLLEVKQGPYIQDADKVRFTVK
jgi:mannose-6-phosphate isomerase-like protein (cupin superfamily)